MYCPNCKQEFDAKFCPECGTRLIESPESGRINMNFGDGNAIKDFQLNDSHNIDNSVTNTTYDSRVINTSNVSNVTNHVVERQKSPEELKAEAKSQFAQYCREAFKDGIITEYSYNLLKSKQLELGLSEDEAKCFIDQHRKATSHQSTTLNTRDTIVLNKIGKLINENNTRMLGAQIPRLKTLASQYDLDEVQYIYYLVIAATRPDELINEYQRIGTDNYWKTYWVYIAYLKNKELEKAENAIRELDKFTKYADENSTLLTAIGMYNDFGTEEAREYIDAIIPEICSDILRDLIYALFTTISPYRVNEVEADKGRCKFFIDNIINLGGPGIKETECNTEKKEGKHAADEKEKQEAEEEARRKAQEEAERNYNIGIEHYNQQEYSEAIKWLKKAAEKDFAKAQCNLGDCYYFGYGVEQSYTEAVKWYKKAAEQEYAQAQYNLGDCYYFGYGVEQSYTEAVKWYTLAAEQGNEKAQEALARLEEVKRKAEEKRKQEAEEEARRKAQEEAEKNYNIGIEHYKKEEYSEAAKWYKKAAEQGHAEAQCQLARCYSWGHGLTKDYSKAFEWYKKAAEQGHAEAQCQLADCYFWGHGLTKDYSKAFEWYKKAAEQGNAEAQGSLGYCYGTGSGTAKNEAEAFKWYKKAVEQGDMNAQENIASYYRKAAEQGDADAQYNFGKCYEYGHGIGIKKDINEAIKWYQKAAEQGHSDAQKSLDEAKRKAERNAKRKAKRAEEKRKQETEEISKRKIQEEVEKSYNLGVEYYNNKRYSEAIEYFKKAAELGSIMAHTYLGICYHYTQKYTDAVEHNKIAAEQGEINAQINLGKSYYAGHGIKQNYAEAFKLFKNAAEKGNEEAQRLVGECYLHGNGTTLDIDEAIKWYTRPAEQGNILAQSSLGICFYLKSYYTEAVKWFQKAARYGEPSAQNNLGNCYRSGKGIKQDYSEAFKLYKQAASKGYADAQNNLGYCYCSGVGTVKDYAEGIMWYRKAAEQGNAGGQVNIGHFFFYANKNYTEAAKWYRLAAEQGNADAQCHLADCYNNGWGVPKDLDKAREWYKRAIAQGHKQAEYKLRTVGVEFCPVFSNDEKESANKQNKSTSIFQKIKDAINKLP